MSKTLKRIIWRWNNLTLDEFIQSFFPEDYYLENLDKNKFSKLYENRIKYLIEEIPSFPFILIKPSGLNLESKIKEQLKKEKVEIIAEHEIQDYQKLAINIYKFGSIKDSIPSNYLWLKMDELKYPNQAKCLVLNPSSINLDKLKKFKINLRRKLGKIKFYKIHYQNTIDTCFSSFIHMPDKEEISREYSILTKYLEAQNETR